MHDQMKAKFLEENEGEQWKTEFIEMISVPGFQFFAEMSQNRFIKTHLPFKLLPPSIMEQRSKVVYVARHPRDVVVSYYHLNKLYRTQGYVNDFDTFFEYFIKDLCELNFFISSSLSNRFVVPCEIGKFKTFFLFAVHWSPYFEHIKDGWSHRHDENVLFIFYEDLMADLEGSLRQLACFLEKPLKDEDLPKLLDHLSIKNFKNNPAINGKDLIDVKILAKDAQGFVRLGSSVKNCELTTEMAEKIDKWIEENLKDSDFRFRI
jgi:hypothetical protein